jgi:GntR family transcriptional regulator
VRASPRTLICSLIEARYSRRIAEIRQDIRAITVSGRMAHPLRLEAGAAALKIVRRYFDAAGKVFEVSVTVHRADRFLVSMRLQRSGS